jgi:hypothetical protein
MQRHILLRRWSTLFELEMYKVNHAQFGHKIFFLIQQLKQIRTNTSIQKTGVDLIMPARNCRKSQYRPDAHVRGSFLKPPELYGCLGGFFICGRDYVKEPQPPQILNAYLRYCSIFLISSFCK